MGFLSSMLPTIVGTTVGVATGNPWLGAAAAGAMGYEQTGSLSKGLMAGASAYSGTDLANGLAGLGTSEAGANISQAAEAAGTSAEQEAIAQQAAQRQAVEAAGQSAMTPQAIESAANQQAQLSSLSPEAWGQSAKEYATDAYVPTAEQQAALNNPVRAGLSSALDSPSKYGAQMGGWGHAAKLGAVTMAPAIADSFGKVATPEAAKSSDLGIRYKYTPGLANPFPQSSKMGEQTYFPGQSYTRISADEGKALYGYAAGGDVQGNDPSDLQGDPNMMNVRAYDPVVRMRKGGVSDMDSQLYGGLDSETSWELKKLARNAEDKPKVTDKEPMKKAAGLSDMPGLEKYAGLSDTKGMYANGGGVSHLGDYSDGGRLLRGPGDGVSDSIPASIGNKRPARLADGEFVVPARIVSELGNGSTEAGARQLYAMMDRVQKARGKTTGKNRVAKDTRAAKHLPA